MKKLLLAPLALLGLAACGGGGDSEVVTDPCAADDSGNVHLSDVDAVVACDFDTDVRTVLINTRTLGESEWGDDGPNDAFCISDFGGHVLEAESSTIIIDGDPFIFHACMVDDAEIAALDAWRP